MSNKNDAIEVNLTNIFQNSDDQGSFIGKRLLKMIEGAEETEAPPFPRQIQIETSNICNHQCSFCAYTLMQRPKNHMDKNLFRQLAKEAFSLGAREIGLFAGAEPLTCKWIDEYIAFCRDIGYEYIYISTNGALANQEKLKLILDAGLNSIKFSVNGGNRETYKLVHQKDDFDTVINNIKFVNEYRKTLTQNVFLGVSFVGMPHTNSTFNDLKELLADIVDEIIFYEASNQSGQMPELIDPPYRNCHLPFNKAHISLEGFLKVCCNDYENLLAVEDLKKMSLMEAWHSERFKALRQKHINNDLQSTVCANCIRGSKDIPKPLNESLASPKQLWIKPIK
jgi:MoaA/NifB/PqqE/SkfB family radical SAM enzyme